MFGINEATCFLTGTIVRRRLEWIQIQSLLVVALELHRNSKYLTLNLSVSRTFFFLLGFLISDLFASSGLCDPCTHRVFTCSALGLTIIDHPLQLNTQQSQLLHTYFTMIHILPFVQKKGKKMGCCSKIVNTRNGEVHDWWLKSDVQVCEPKKEAYISIGKAFKALSLTCFSRSELAFLFLIA